MGFVDIIQYSARTCLTRARAGETEIRESFHVARKHFDSLAVVRFCDLHTLQTHTAEGILMTCRQSEKKVL